MVKFSIILPILSISVQSKPQFSNIFDQFGDTFDQVGDTFVNNFGGADISGLLDQANQGFHDQIDDTFENTFGGADISGILDQANQGFHDQFGDTFGNTFGGVDLTGILDQANQGFQTVLDAAGGLPESELFQNLDIGNLPFNLDDISSINELTTDLVNNALDFSFEDLTSLTTNFESFTQDIDVQQVLDNALDTVKGTQVFEDLFSGVDIADLFSSSSSFNFAGVSEQAAESLNGLDVSGGYNAFLESVFEIRHIVSDEDQALIVAAIGDSGIPFSSTLSRQVENAFDVNDFDFYDLAISAGAGDGFNVSGVRLGFFILASMFVFG